MKPPSPLLAGLLILASLLVLGCGDAAPGESAQSYGEVLHGLRQAALEGQPYHGARRAHELPPPQRVVLSAFCNFAWQMKANREEEKLSWHAYLVGRIQGAAELALEGAHSREVGAAMRDLRAAVRLPDLDAHLVKNYVHACYA